MRFTLAFFAIVAAANAINLPKVKATSTVATPASSKLQNVKVPSLTPATPTLKALTKTSTTPAKTPAALSRRPAIVSLVGPGVSAKTKAELKAFYQAQGVNGKVSFADKKTI